MNEMIATFPDPDEALARLPAISVGTTHACFISADGEIADIGLEEAAERIQQTPHLLCNLPLITRRLRIRQVDAFDVLELFAFIRPARFVLPTIGGLAQALGLSRKNDPGSADAHMLHDIAQRLIADVTADIYRWRKGLAATAFTMARAGWRWGPIVLGALGQDAERSGGLAAWQGLSEWEEGPPPPPASNLPIDEEESVKQLLSLLGEDAETRQAQRDYAAGASHAFRPAQTEDAPNVALAEAGTGTGKTLGYIAPASLWARKNGGPVWISTYTKALQRQIDQELARLYPDPKERAARTAIRKGRENYACLLNIEDAARVSFSGAAGPRDAVLMGLVLRWLSYSRDGDMVGGDFPNWLGSYFGRTRLGQLTDHRGECLYSACAHYRRCFIEKAVRKSKRAELVIANHALVMTQAVSRQGDPDLPKRLVFDEGHHIFDAADSAFAAHLSGLEGAELRRWLRGRETATKGRARGLLSRIEDLVSDDEDAWAQLQTILDVARVLPAHGWLQRISTGGARGPFEAFLAHVRAQVLARAPQNVGPHSMECETHTPLPELLASANDLSRILEKLAGPLSTLAKRLVNLLDENVDSLDSGSRGRLEATARSLLLRAEMVRAWIQMLSDLDRGPGEQFLDWFELERIEGREVNAGFFRHWVDPTIPYAKAVLEPAHGALITSATLLDRRVAEEEQDWSRAETRVGTSHLVLPAKRLSVPSPFDYEKSTRIFIVTDVNKMRMEQLASAYRALFLAAGGGALGLFTAIARLRAVYQHIAPALEDMGLSLYAQHVDPIDTGTLVDIFRAEEDACLLGTDAVRDGVDVPGNSLRLIVFDRVPWPRPTLLHKARRQAFGGRNYDEMVARLRLSQAYGRLIRRATDRGVFIMLDNQTPSRLLSAFPENAVIERLGLKDVIAKTRTFLEDSVES